MADSPKPPAHLSKRMKAFWRRVVDDYALEPHHLELFRLACEALDRTEEARAVIAAEGAFVSTRNGVRAHPAIAVERDSRLAAARLFRELDLEGEPLPDPRPPRRA